MALVACRTRGPLAGAAGAMDATAMGSWPQWQDLEPFVTVAADHADDATIATLKRAQALLRQGKAARADRELANAAETTGRHWIAVARGNVAALHFTLCIRGIAWRISDSDRGESIAREIDFSEERRIAPGDISVEATLTGLDAAVASKIDALQVQARIARARVAAYAERCPANDDVAKLAQQIVEADLATLAAQGHLTPDLAYLWAGVQMSRFSGSAAQPFLLQAREGGFDHPAVTYMLAVIALDSGEFERADRFATEAIGAYAELGDREQQAQGLFLRGQIAQQAGREGAARSLFETALQLMPDHTSAHLAIAELIVEQHDESQAREYLHGALRTLMPTGPLRGPAARTAADNLESLVISAEDPFLAQLCRDALLAEIDEESDPMRRGLRYFYSATIDVRLREYELAVGHGVLAKDEFESIDEPAPVDVSLFLDRLMESG